MNRLSVVLFVFVSLLVLANVARAQVAINVDATGIPRNNCNTASSMVFNRITDAVACARTIRTKSNQDIVINVSSGISYKNECLPIVLNVPGLKVIGGTVLVLDGGGIPTSDMPTQQTAIVPSVSTACPAYSIFTITADHVTLAGFYLDGTAITNEIIAIHESENMGAIRDFVVSGNYLINNIGLGTRLASGQVTGNYFMPGGGKWGAFLTGGHVDDPAMLTVDHNRANGDSSGNNRWGMVISGSMSSLVDTTDPNFPSIPSTPGKAVIEVFENDFSNFPIKGTGIKFTTNYPGGT